MKENERNGLLNTGEVATRLRVNPSTVRRWRLDDVGPRYLRVGGIHRYPATSRSGSPRACGTASPRERGQRPATRRQAHGRRRGGPAGQGEGVQGTSPMGPPGDSPPGGHEARVRVTRRGRRVADTDAGHRRHRRRPRADAERLRHFDRGSLDPRHRPDLDVRPVLAGLRLRALPTLGHLPVGLITAGRVDRAIDRWEQQHSRSTVKNSVAVLDLVLDEAVRDGIIVRNPAKDRARRKTTGRSTSEPDRGSVNPRDLALPDVSTLDHLVGGVVEAGGHQCWGTW
jgi:hypothetical protein